jgi:hypothetical protein
MNERCVLGRCRRSGWRRPSPAGRLQTRAGVLAMTLRSPCAACRRRIEALQWIDFGGADGWGRRPVDERRHVHNLARSHPHGSTRRKTILPLLPLLIPSSKDGAAKATIGGVVQQWTSCRTVPRRGERHEPATTPSVGRRELPHSLQTPYAPAPAQERWGYSARPWKLTPAAPVEREIVSWQTVPGCGAMLSAGKTYLRRRVGYKM